MGRVVTAVAALLFILGVRLLSSTTSTAGPRPRGSAVKRHSLVHPWVTNEALVLLEAEAQARGMHVDVLAAQILNAIATEGLFGAVLDR